MAFVKRLFGWLILGPVAVIALALAVANRTLVTLSWNPFERSDGIEMPLFVVAFVMFALGALAGGFAVWMAQGRWRREAKTHRAEVRLLSGELAQMRSDPALPSAR
ncbi:MAG: LapA family protein [Hyphomicrobiales bacterium]|nr:LapA family protein [Hyphomicrobiales bacterium]OQW84141.1 MAG: hypothetical protein BVN31_03950 [Proteobacteria bacterium ST_bin15]